jgi:hypothetical protein
MQTFKGAPKITDFQDTDKGTEMDMKMDTVVGTDMDTDMDTDMGTEKDKDIL